MLDSGEAGAFADEFISLQTNHSDFSPTCFGGTCDSASGGAELPRLRVPIQRSETIGLRRPTRRSGQSVYWSDTPLEIETVGEMALADKGSGELSTGGTVLRSSQIEASGRHLPASKARNSGIESPAREPERGGEAPAEPLMRQHQLMHADFNQPPKCVSRRAGTDRLTNVVMTAVGETHCGSHTASGNRPNQNHPNHRRSTPGDQPSHPWCLGAPLVWLTVWLSLATIVWGFNHDVRKMVRSRPTPAPVAYSSGGAETIDPIPTSDSSTPRLSLANSTDRPADRLETVTGPNGKRYRARRIRDIQTGHRVLARNPQVDPNSLTDADIDPADWVNVGMRLENPDGGVLNVVLLRPVDWLADRLETSNTVPASDRLDRSASAAHGQIPYLPGLGESNDSSSAQQQLAALHVEVDRSFLNSEQGRPTVADALTALPISERPASDRLARERLWIHLDLPEIGAVGR
ncbi:MAG: hypothetical protein NT069_20260, partial [Planctomycetota bacterium]|nr:hypothetical protein [Planctomycetota bacterium]